MNYLNRVMIVLKNFIVKRFFICVLGSVISLQGFHAMGASLVACGGNFNQFLQRIGVKAVERGVEKNSVLLALKYSKHSQKVLEMDRKQRTFRLSFLDFSERAINTYRLKNGIKNIERYKKTFQLAKSKYGVPAEVISAFWAMETDFGAVQGKFNTLSSLATLAHDCRRPEMFQEEYVSAIALFADGVIEKEITGAWAGEIGQVQMLPSDIKIFGQDGDGDGIVDLKKSAPDAILTAAALISDMGWIPNQPWIEEVKMDSGFPWEEAGFGRERALEAWKRLGIKSRTESFKANDQAIATLLIPQGRKGPKFLAYSNFKVYLSWNDSFIYTVTAAHLATRLGGAKKLISGDPEDILTVEEMIELQKILKSKGFNVGEIDGILGRNTRQSVRKMQLELGFPGDSWPTRNLLKKLR